MVVDALDLERVKAASRDAIARRPFWEEHYHELKRQYPDQFVAVKETAVVAASQDLFGLVDALGQQGLG
ncbi:MAG: hypothetical protein ACR2PL_26515 [Dehalococcoidia bacterium]